MIAMTIYNNYLDKHASFEHFVYDSVSTSKHSEWAVGPSLRRRNAVLVSRGCFHATCQRNGKPTFWPLSQPR